MGSSQRTARGRSASTSPGSGPDEERRFRERTERSGTAPCGVKAPLQ